jgi:hypothetical protein
MPSCCVLFDFSALTGKLVRVLGLRLPFRPRLNVREWTVLALRLLDRLLGRNACDRLFQYTVGLFACLCLKRAGRSALPPFDVVPESLPTLVLGADGGVILARLGREIT